MKTLIIREDLSHVDNWLKGNKLSLNVMKTHYMPISTEPKLIALKSKNESLKCLSIENIECTFLAQIETSVFPMHEYILVLFLLARKV